MLSPRICQKLSILFALAFTSSILTAEASTGSLAPGEWHHQVMDLPLGHAGLRAHLATGAFPGLQLYLRQGSPSTLSEYDQRQVSAGDKTLAVRDGVERSGTWYVSVHWPAGSTGSATYDLQVTPGWAQELAWDPGTAEAGTLAQAQPDTRGGWYYFRQTVGTSAIGLWRARLVVTAGEADLYVVNGLSAFAPNQASFSSVRVGSDGLLRSASSVSAEITLLVRADPGAEWTLVSGEAWAQSLPDLIAVDGGAPRDSANAATQSFVIPPEGQRLFRTMASSSTSARAWRLWAYQGSGETVTTWSGPLAIRRAVGALVDGQRDWQQVGQMLVVAPYLGTGSDTYFLALGGEPGTPGVLDSRPQEIVDLPFESFTGGPNPVATVEVPAGETGGGRFGYRTFRVQVPIQQLGWEVTVTPESGARPGVAVRQGEVPSEWWNTALQEGAGSSPHGLTIAPPLLSDGTWFITVYGAGPYRVALTSRAPTPGPIEITTTGATTTEPDRAGWHYFVLTDIEGQLATLGWQLELAGAATPNDLAVRRNALPYQTRSRSGWGQTAVQTGQADATSSTGLLQRAGQPADVWYVGVASPLQAVGAFALDTFPIGVTTANFDSTDMAVSGARPGEWRYFRFEVPATAGGSPLLGWELALRGLTESVQAYVRRDGLPRETGSGDPFLSGSATSWGSGAVTFLTQDYSRRPQSADGTRTSEGTAYGLFPMGQPLEPGTYYLGVRASGSQPVSYTVWSRGIGAGAAKPVTTLDWSSGEAVVGSLEPRDTRFFAVDVPEGQQSWRLRLENGVGESSFVIRRGSLPSTSTFSGGDLSRVDGVYPLASYRDGDESLVIAAGAGQTIAPGRFYIAAVSEGDQPAGLRIGADPASFTLRSEGPQPVEDLGLVGSGETMVRTDGYAAGEHRVYRFSVPPGVLALEVRLVDRTGNPLANLAGGFDLPSMQGNQFPNQVYGWHSGSSPLSSGTLLSLSNPAAGSYTVLVGDGSSHYSQGGTRTAAGAYRLEVEARTESVLAFADGVATVTDQANGTWQFFRVEVPEQGTGPDALAGWHLRLVEATHAGLSLTIRRGEVPPGGSFQNLDAASWPVGNSSAASPDFTERWQSVDLARNFDNAGSWIAAFGRPLEPGTYFVGIQNQSGQAASYQVISRAVGPGAAVPLDDIPEGGSLAVSVGPRGLSAFRFEIPEGQRSWQVRAETLVGDAVLAVRRGYLPTYQISNQPLSDEAQFLTNLSRRDGEETLLILPPEGREFLPAGSYYALVESRGANPLSATAVGPDPAELVLHNDGPLPIEDLGTLATGGAFEREVTYPAGKYRAYRVTVPAGLPILEAELQERVGNPAVTVRRGERLSRPFGNQLFSQVYGVTGGENGQGGTAFATITEPQEDSYLIVVGDASSHYLSSGTRTADGSARLIVRAPAPVVLPANGGIATVSDQQPGSWRYFEVQVPATLGLAEVLGWEVRTRGLDQHSLSFSVRRARLPESSPPFVGITNPWVVGRQVSFQTDFSRRSQGLSGPELFSSAYLRYALGEALAPDTYYIGVRHGGNEPATYSLTSSLIGEGLALPVTEVAFEGGQAMVSGLAPRDTHTFAIDVPEGVFSLELEADGGAADVDLYVRRAFVPDVTGADTNSHQHGDFVTLRAARVGAERLVVAPTDAQPFLPAGRYYATVVVIGEGAPSALSVGHGVASVTLRSHGELAAQDLGALGGAAVVTAGSYVAGQQRAYQIDLPAGLLAVTIQLEDRVGNPFVGVARGSRLPILAVNPSPVPANPNNRYGVRTGVTALASGPNAITIERPEPGLHTILVGDGSQHTSGQPTAAGSYTLRVAQVVPETLNFAESQNAGGGSHTASATLANGERRYFEVTVPEGLQLDDEDILGWKLNLVATQGSVSARLHFDPERMQDGLLLQGGTHLITPPYLRPGQWLLEVTANGTTTFTATSQRIELERAAWTLPTTTEPPVATGNLGGYFGDSGVDPDGQPLPGDQGIDLGDGDYHVYAVDVPAGNAGLLRTVLVALNGNPNLYLRRDAVPSRSHRPVAGAPFFSWNGEGSYERSLIGSGTEYGNWVPLDAKSERELAPGRYFIAVQGLGTNVRYRLRLSAGELADSDLPAAQRFAQALPLDGTPLADQTLAAGDWRYYRIDWPEDPAQTLQFTFSQTSGAVVAHLRAIVPAGHGTNVSEIRDWSWDMLNQPPSGVSLQSWSTPGTVSVESPLLRPNTTYWIGFRATADATFTVSAITSGPSLSERFGPITDLDFYSGVIDTTLAPGASAYYRVIIPEDGVRWRFQSQVASGVTIFIEEGTVPQPGAGSHRSMTSGLFSQFLDSAPWFATRTYYLRITNSTGSSQPVVVTMDGRNALTDDEDNDGLPDAWERFYFGNTWLYGAQDDPDGDGVTNINEYLRGTDPTDPDSVLYELRLAGVGATAQADTSETLFERGAVVAVTAAPDSGLAFIGWGFNEGAGIADGATFTAVMTREIRLTAYAGIPLAEALDAPALEFMTGGLALGVGQTADTSDGTDAVRIAGPLLPQERGWVETVVNGPGRLSFQWRLQQDNPAPAYLRLHINGIDSATVFSTSAWAEVTRTINNEGPVTVRWMLEAVGGQPIESAAVGYLDQVGYVEFLAPAWRPIERVSDSMLRLSWDPAPNATNYIVQVYSDPGLTSLLTSQFVSPPFDFANPAAGVTRYVRVAAFFQGSQGPFSEVLEVNRIEAQAPQDAWAQRFGLSSFDPLADLNGDGRTLLYAYGLNLDPREGGGSGIASGLTTVDGLPYVTLTFVRRTDDPRLSYLLREGATLGSAGSVDISARLVGSPVSVGPGLEQVTVRGSHPVEPGTPSGFLWIEINLAP